MHLNLTYQYNNKKYWQKYNNIKYKTIKNIKIEQLKTIKIYSNIFNDKEDEKEQENNLYSLSRLQMIWKLVQFLRSNETLIEKILSVTSNGNEINCLTMVTNLLNLLNNDLNLVIPIFEVCHNYVVVLLC